MQLGFVEGGGGKARERSDRAGGGCGRGVSLLYSREIFENSCMKTAYSCTLIAIIRGNLCTGINQFPITLFPFLFFFTRRSTGGPWPPCAPLSYASVFTYRICYDWKRRDQFQTNHQTCVEKKIPGYLTNCKLVYKTIHFVALIIALSCCGSA